MNSFDKANKKINELANQSIQSAQSPSKQIDEMNGVAHPRVTADKQQQNVDDARSQEAVHRMNSFDKANKKINELANQSIQSAQSPSKQIDEMNGVAHPRVTADKQQMEKMRAASATGSEAQVSPQLHEKRASGLCARANLSACSGTCFWLCCCSCQATAQSGRSHEAIRLKGAIRSA